MAEYKAPLRDMRFLLDEVFKVDQLWKDMPELNGLTLDDACMILEEGAKICEKELFPLNRSGDEEECRIEGDQVFTPKGFKEAYQTFAANGWTGLGGNSEYGGQGMPKMVTLLFEEMMFAANSSFTLYPSLTAGGCMALDKHASQALKDTYLANMYEGKWAGTMCLTEPHCGTDLGIMRTKAVEQEDGSYDITGTKIFITGGEHDLTENIVHLVLAKLPDAPAGTRGISLFLVPKFLVNEDGSLGERNGAAVGSIEHKMGIKASATCVMNFDGAKGWLVGELNKGLAAMFTMMNYERLTIGLQGLASGDMSYQHAVEYAKDRGQGRAATGAKAPRAAADPIIVHGDVRRMLLTMRVLNEAGRAFGLYVGKALDAAKFHPDQAERERSSALVELLTPVAKAFFSDRGLESCVLGQQVFGGHGYIREWGVEQLVRDVRIAQIYEGTNGIQALDLMGRKTVRAKGALLAVFAEEINQAATVWESDERLAPFVAELKAGLDCLNKTTQFILDSVANDPDLISASAVEYLDLVGYVSYAYMWLKILSSAKQGLEGSEASFYETKFELANFYFKRIYPRVHTLVKTIESGADSVMRLADDRF